MMRPNFSRRPPRGLRSPLLHILASIAAAYVLASSAHAITLDDAVRKSLAGNLDLRAAKFEVEKARGRLIQAGLWPNPSVEFGFRADLLGNNEGERTVSAGFVQAFPITGRLKFARQVSRVDVAQAMVEIRNRERLLIGEVQRDYLTVLVLERQIASNREFIGVNRDFVTLFQERLKKAEVSEVDVNLARVEMQRVELETAVLGADLSSRELALKQRLGIGPAGRLEVEGDVEALAAKFRPEKYSPTMVVNRPDLRLVELSVDRAQAEIRLARAAAWEDWSVGFDYENDRTTDDPNGLGTNNFSGLKFSIPLALWNRNQGKVHEQQAAADQARQQIEALRLSIRTEIATSIAQATKLREVVGTYQTTLLPTLTSTTELLKKGLKEGLTDATRLVQAQQQRATLRASYLTAYTSYVQALVELETASGGSPFLSKDFLIERTAPSKSRSSYRK